jgi:hypothetical protein
MRQVVVPNVICELRYHSIEEQLDVSNRAVPLLCDDDFGKIVNAIGLGFPLFQIIATVMWFLPKMIIILSVDKHDNIGVLLD